jgi:hypothetical protein
MDKGYIYIKQLILLYYTEQFHYKIDLITFGLVSLKTKTREAYWGSLRYIFFGLLLHKAKVAWSYDLLPE